MVAFIFFNLPVDHLNVDLSFIFLKNEFCIKAMRQCSFLYCNIILCVSMHPLAGNIALQQLSILDWNSNWHVLVNFSTYFKYQQEWENDGDVYIFPLVQLQQFGLDDLCSPFQSYRFDC